MEKAEWRSAVPAGADVALKPNLGWDMFLPGAVTSPWVVEGVIRVLREHVGKLYLVESDQVLVRCERALRQTRMDELCARYGVEWVNMSAGRFVTRAVPDALVLRQVDVPEILTRTVLVTIPVMKTHNKTTITGAIKNQWGCLSKPRHNLHLVLDPALVDLNRVVRPRFAVMDATIALEGDGPKSGRPRLMDMVLASADIVALDSVQARIMGFVPEEIEHLKLCAQHGLGVLESDRIEIVGEPLEGVATRFRPAKHNLVSWVELALRTSRWRRFVFGTCVLDLMCAGALFWYFLWYYLGPGRRLRDGILLTSRYGPQWRDGAGQG
jgi:uncharacterized protein (DUF362 family)